ADDGDGLAGLDMEGEVVDAGARAGEAEGDVLERDLAAQPRHRPRAGPLLARRAGILQRVERLERGAGLKHLVAEAGQLVAPPEPPPRTRATGRAPGRSSRAAPESSSA